MMIGALVNQWFGYAASKLSLVALSETTMNCVGWLLFAEADNLAASKILDIFSSSTTLPS